MVSHCLYSLDTKNTYPISHLLILLFYIYNACYVFFNVNPTYEVANTLMGIFISCTGNGRQETGDQRSATRHRQRRPSVQEDETTEGVHFTTIRRRRPHHVSAQQRRPPSGKRSAQEKRSFVFGALSSRRRCPCRTTLTKDCRLHT